MTITWAQTLVSVMSELPGLDHLWSLLMPQKWYLHETPSLCPWPNGILDYILPLSWSWLPMWASDSLRIIISSPFPTDHSLRVWNRLGVVTAHSVPTEGLCWLYLRKSSLSTKWASKQIRGPRSQAWRHRGSLGELLNSMWLCMKPRWEGFPTWGMQGPKLILNVVSNAKYMT